VKWAQLEAGHVIEGTYHGSRAGKFGPLADIETVDGPLTLPVPTALGRQLARVKVGASVAIQYDGLKHNAQTKFDYHSFRVFVDDPANLLPDRGRRNNAGDELPF
jgi:hypothetical protein